MRLVFAAVLAALLSSAAARAATLDGVRESGALRCGVVTDVDDYSLADTHGDLSAFGTDFCRALAAEIFGPTGKVLLQSLPDEPAGRAAVRDGKIDVLFGATPNPVIGAVEHLRFGPPFFFDGQGFLVARDGGIAKPADLSGRQLCFVNASAAEINAYDVLEPMLAEREGRYPFSERGEMEAAFLGGHCDAITGDVSWLANIREAFQKQGDRFAVLPQTITLDPLAPAMRDDDAEWAALVDWTVWALIAAEEHGVTQANAATLHDSPDPVVRRLVGELPWMASHWHLPQTMFRSALEAVGNYGEIYARDITDKLDLPRGENKPSSQGGLLWSLPITPLR